MNQWILSDSPPGEQDVSVADKMTPTLVYFSLMKLLQAAFTCAGDTSLQWEGRYRLFSIGKKTLCRAATNSFLSSGTCCSALQHGCIKWLVDKVGVTIAEMAISTDKQYSVQQGLQGGVGSVALALQHLNGHEHGRACDV